MISLGRTLCTGLFESTYTSNALTLAWAQVGNTIRLFPGRSDVARKVYMLSAHQARVTVDVVTSWLFGVEGH